MKISKKIIALLLSATLAVTSFAGCANIDGFTNDGSDNPNLGLDVHDRTNVYGDYIIKLDDYEIGFEEYRYYYHYMESYLAKGDANYFSTDGNLKTLKEETLKQLKYTYSIEQLAEEEGIEITDEMLASVQTQLDATIESLGGEEGYKEALASSFLTEEIYEKMALNSELQNEVIRKIYGEDMIKFANDNYLRASHILIGFDTEEPTRQEINEKQALAEDILAKANAGEDFAGLIKEYGEDPGQTDPNAGYYFKEGDMVEPFYEGTLALEVGKISGLVESDFGFHIIKRLPIEESYIFTNPAAFMTEEQLLEINTRSEDIANSMEVVYCDKYDEISPFTI